MLARSVMSHFAPHDAGNFVVFGDSITAGFVASDEAHRWANLVTAHKGPWRLYNSGASGTVLQNTVQNSVTNIGGPALGNGRDTYTTRVLPYLPTWVAILYGLNDIRLNDAAFTVAAFQNDLGELIDGLTASGILASHIYIGSPPYIPATTYPTGAPWDGGSVLKHTQYVAACAAVAAVKGTGYIDVYQWMIDNGGDSLIRPDGIHPNDAGHQAIADAFLSVM